MIYNNTYFKEQLKKTYIEGSKGKISLWFCVIAIALITTIFHNFFYAMRETVFAEVLPHFVQHSFFGLLSVFNIVIIIFFVALCITKYRRITIAEMSTNKWYMMIKTGHSPIKLVFLKLSANIISVACIYSLTFVLLILIGSLLKLEMQINAIFSLAILGLIQLFFVVELIMGISVFINSRGNCLLLVIVGLFLMSLLARVTGFNEVAQSLIKMEDTSYLFTGNSSWYIYGLLIAGFIMLFLGGIKSWLMSEHYNPKAQLGENVYSINYINNKTRYIKDRSGKQFSLFKAITKFTLVLIVIVSVLANIGVIMLATLNNPNSDKGDHIMMLFESQTMSGVIEANDFVWFDKIAADEELHVGDVVLYYDSNSLVVQIVKKINSDGSYLVDYVSYPSGVKEGSYSNDITANEISGKLSGKSSWLGAFFVWNKTIVAKLLTTVLPTIILVFYDKIEGLIRLAKQSAGTDEEDGSVEISRQEYLVLNRDDSASSNAAVADSNNSAIDTICSDVGIINSVHVLGIEENSNEDLGVLLDVTATDESDDSDMFNSKIRYTKSFTAKLIQSTDSTKQHYNAIKNALLSIKRVKSKISWNYECFSIGRKQLVKIAVRGKTLNVYLALNADILTNNRYKLEAVASKKYASVPYLYKIKSNRRAKYTIELINKQVEEFSLNFGKVSTENFISQYAYDTTENLIEKNLIKENK